MGNITIEQQEFFNVIKDDCIKISTQNNILPSVIGGISALISNYGNSNIYKVTNNLFMLKVDDNWAGRCYSFDSNCIYDNVKECKEYSTTLLKVFSNTGESISQFIEFINTSRRSENGPLKYNSIVGDMDYKNAINKLSRLGFVKEFMYTTTSYFFNTCVSIIENAKLYDWDNEVKENMSRKKRSNRAPQSTVQTISAEEYVSHMYRVRLDWDKPDTQIFASPNYEAAKSKALEHEGYKIYIDDDGELFEDPWIKKEEVKPVTMSTNIPGVKDVIHPFQGRVIDLHNTPVYRNASDKMYFKQISGRFYFYDETIVNGRAKITATQHMIKKNPSYILGYININQ